MSKTNLGLALVGLIMLVGGLGKCEAAPLPTAVQLVPASAVIIDKVPVFQVFGRLGGFESEPGSTSLSALLQSAAEYLDTSHRKTINFMIDSGGGNYDNGAQSFLAWLDYLPSQDVTVNCVVSGMAASLALIVLSHCQNKFVVPTAMLMWHPARVSQLPWSNPAELRIIADRIEAESAALWAALSVAVEPEFWALNYKNETILPAIAVIRHLTDAEYLKLVVKPADLPNFAD